MKTIYNENNSVIIAFLKEGDVDIEYENALEALKIKPDDAPEGYEYLLNPDMEWFLSEIADDGEATENDYLAALADMGVDVDEEEGT